MRTALIILYLSLSLACSPPEPEGEPVYRPVRTEVVRLSGGRSERTFSGSARSGLVSKLSFRVAGTILTLNVKLGDRVRRGDVIATLDPSDYQLQVDDAEASLRQARAQSRNAASSYDRIRGLYENNNVSINDLDAARTAMESAKAAVQSIEKKLELAQSQLSYTQLTAPLDGAIAEVEAEVNENIRAGQTIVALNAGARAEITFVVPEQLVASVREGSPITARFDALPGQEMPATITEVGVASGSISTTYPVIARLNEPRDDVLPGMAAEVTLVFGEAEGEGTIHVKPAAVNEDDNGRYCFVAVPAGEGLATVARRTVTIGRLSPEGLEILTGLEVGDRLITAGTRFIEDGMTVKAPDESGVEGLE